MTKITITYDTDDVQRGLLRAEVPGKTGAWSLGVDTVANIDAVLTAHYGDLDGTGCGWSSDDDDEYYGIGGVREPF